MDFEKIIAKIRAGKTWRFHGGIHPAEHKDESSGTPIERLEPASVYIVPVRQHSGDAGTVCVKVGDYVKKGDPLTRSSGRRDLPVSAPTSGTIAKIGLHTAPHQSGLPDLEITITPDGKDEWRERNPIKDFKTKTPEELLHIIHSAGIAGMGGAGFPADQKIAGAVGKTHILIINGSECEPYITCDDRLMREKAAEIIEGVRILQYILKPEVTLIAIEDNKKEAAKAIESAVSEGDDIIVRVLETRYPTGAARPLIRRLTGIEVGYTSRSTDFGIEMQNVATTYAIKRAVEDDEPLVERIVTVTGNNFGRKGNFIVPFGTPVRHILDKCKWHGEARNELILGGPMMGFTVPTPDVSVTKTINCVFSPDSTEVMSYDNPLECIRCGRCARVCPSRLLPFALVKAAKAGDSEAIQRERIRDCIECGCCAFVCPSRIPLVRFIRIAKARIREESAEARKKQNTERLIAEKLSREEKIAAARKARIAALKETSVPKADSTAASAGAAVTAATAAGNGSAGTSASASSAAGAARPKSAALAAALARAKAQKTKEAAQNEAAASNAAADAGAASGASQTAASADVTSVSAEAQGSAAGSAKSKALAAALAKAKARKAAVAAALAKARARKAAAAGESSENRECAGAVSAESTSESQAGAGAEREAKENSNSAKAPAADPKKAALAAALARAKARKQAETDAQPAEEAAPANPVKSAGEDNSAESAGSETSSAKAPAADPRKAAVAAALARARARKKAIGEASSEDSGSQEKAAKSEEERAPSEENK
ncbi:MAG: electron transport complex subunit RsxC [Succinivibrionaceae bacterium]|nr:electron transport complex subunit RsxC [Succinivibrionaceae bacterium]MDY6374521.1 electron transport complex subunit RsxC [Succinivibrionaceae bacterium]